MSPLDRLDVPIESVVSDATLVENRVVIAGGGPSGMAAALVMARAGVPVTVLEADRVGRAIASRCIGRFEAAPA